jgi:hypothetical protein
MKSIKYKKKKAQSALESVVAYAGIMMILGAAFAIFGWGIAHIPIRQMTYEVTRTAAGRPGGRTVDEHGARGCGKAALWPTYRAFPIF